MAPEPRLTAAEKILLAALDLEGPGRTSPFTLSELVVKCWQKYPKTFGLEHYLTDHPDSNKVSVALAGAKGLVSRGWLTRTGSKTYALTAAGLKAAKGLGAETAAPFRPKHPDAGPPPEKLAAFLGRCLYCTAMSKAERGLTDEITFPEACEFWGYSSTPASSGPSLFPYLDAFVRDLAISRTVLRRGPYVLDDGREVGLEDVFCLQQLHDALSTQFSRHLRLLAERAKVIA